MQRNWRRRSTPLHALTVLALLLAGCASTTETEGGGSCAQAFEYRGETYYALKTHKPVPGVRSIGDVKFGSCVTSGDDEAAAEDAKARFPAQSIEGIDPSVAFVVPTRDPGYIYYSGPSDASTFPSEVEALLNR